MENIDIPARFVIVASQRTGSNMLVSVLRTHPEIACYGELFRKNRKQFTGSVKVFEDIDKRFQVEEYRHKNWQQLLDAVVCVSNEAKFVGFKLMVNQHPAARKALISDQAYKKILLERENVLAVYSSDKIARVTGQGSAGRFAEVKTARVEFDKLEFESFLQQYRARFLRAKKELEASGNSYLATTYARICTHRGLEEVMEFLGADKSSPWGILTKKRNPSDLLARFVNRADVEQYLRDTGLECWANEGP